MHTTSLDLLGVVRVALDSEMIPSHSEANIKWSVQLHCNARGWFLRALAVAAANKHSCS